MEITNFMHMELGEGRATAAISFAQEEEVEVAYIGMSFCSPGDQFSKRKGRLIASGRLMSGKHFYRLELDPDKRVSKQIREVITRGIETLDTRFPWWLVPKT